MPVLELVNGTLIHYPEDLSPKVLKKMIAPQIRALKKELKDNPREYKKKYNDKILNLADSDCVTFETRGGKYLGHVCRNEDD